METIIKILIFYVIYKLVKATIKSHRADLRNKRLNEKMDRIDKIEPKNDL
tara:strand:+ start:255 stop:404 length:150 start_codon:yes stop_codon:yes gene_type:complete